MVGRMGWGYSAAWCFREWPKNFKPRPSYCETFSLLPASTLTHPLRPPLRNLPQFVSDWCGALAHPLITPMTTPHVIASSSGNHSTSTASNGMVGTHYRVGKKIGEGSFGVVFEGTFLLCAPIESGEIRFMCAQPSMLVFSHSGVNILTNTPVAIKFVCFQCPQFSPGSGGACGIPTTDLCRRSGTTEVRSPPTPG